MDLNLLIRVFEKQDNGPQKITINEKEYIGQWRYFSETVGYYSPAVKREEISLGANDVPETMGLFSGSFDGTTWDELDEFEKQSFIKNYFIFKDFLGVSNEAYENIDEQTASALWRGKFIFDGDVYDSTVRLRSTNKTFTRVFLVEVFSPLLNKSVELFRNYKENDENFLGENFEQRGTSISRVFNNDSTCTVIMRGNRYENPDLLLAPDEEQNVSKQTDSTEAEEGINDIAAEKTDLFNSIIEYQGVKIKIFDVNPDGIEHDRIEKMKQLIWDAKKAYLLHLEHMKEKTLKSPDSEFCFPLSEEAFIATYIVGKIYD